MSERLKQLIPAVVLLVALVATLIWGIVERQRQQQYHTMLENMYERSFYELVDNVGNMEVQLSKLLVTETPEQSMALLTDVWHKADSAQGSFSLLPVQLETMTDSAKFINQVGDYCLSLSQQVARGKPISQTDLEQLQTLQQRMTTLGNEIRDIQAQNLSGEQKLWNGALQDVKASDVIDPFEDLSRQGAEYPSLIYDGPFSDASSQPPKALDGQWIDYTQAELIARQFVGENRVEWTQPSSESLGEIPTWGVEMMLSRDGVVTVHVTKQGGHILWMVPERLPQSFNYSLDECYAHALEFLQNHGYPSVDLNYYQAYEGVVVLNFVPLQDDVLLYPDLIKVQVSLETCQVVGFEAGNYLRNHTQRVLEQAEISSQDASLLASRLQIERVRLCLIPQVDQEIFCYEITGTFLGERYLMYIDAKTGSQVNLYKIIDVEGGQLAM